MDMTPLLHVPVALAIQAAVAWPLRRRLDGWHWLTGAVAATCFYLGREVTQHERKMADRLRVPVVEMFPEGFYLWHWSADALLDLAVPSVVVFGLAFVCRRFRKPAGVCP